MTNDGKLVTALVSAINNPARVAPLMGLAFIKYPGRELQQHILPDGAVQFVLHKWGFEYKNRGPKLQNPPPADTTAIQMALNAALAPRFTVCTVTDEGRKIVITMEEKP